MIKRVIKLVVFAAFLAFVANAWVDDEKKLDRIAKENNLDAEQTAAFRSCDSDMNGKMLTIGDATYSHVPDEICVCQSREMVAVFKEGAYSSHENVVEFLTDEKTRRPLNANHLKHPSNPANEFARLEESLVQCTILYSLERSDRAREAQRRAEEERGG